MPKQRRRAPQSDAWNWQGGKENENVKFQLKKKPKPKHSNSNIQNSSFTLLTHELFDVELVNLQDRQFAMTFAV